MHTLYSIAFFTGYYIMISSYYQNGKSGIIIHLKVIPNSSKNEVCGIINDANGQEFLKVKVTAIPDEGKANKALLKFLSKEWNIKPSDIEIISGQTSRIKKIQIINNTEQFLKYLQEI